MHSAAVFDREARSGAEALAQSGMVLRWVKPELGLVSVLFDGLGLELQARRGRAQLQDSCRNGFHAPPALHRAGV